MNLSIAFARHCSIGTIFFLESAAFVGTIAQKYHLGALSCCIQLNPVPGQETAYILTAELHLRLVQPQIQVSLSFILNVYLIFVAGL